MQNQVFADRIRAALRGSRPAAVSKRLRRARHMAGEVTPRHYKGVEFAERLRSAL
jgi:hypothetical protein